MADKKQEFVTHITPRNKDFSQWYTDVVTMADLMDYTPVRGCMAITGWWKPSSKGVSWTSWACWWTSRSSSRL